MTLFQSRPVIFRDLSSHHIVSKTTTSSYNRPLGRSKLTSVVSNDVSTDKCESQQQVHITLGNDQNSIIISFTSTQSRTQSKIFYSTSRKSIETIDDKNPMVMVATGDVISYSQLLFVNDYLIDPMMGAPYETNAHVADLQDTSAWAFDKSTHEPWYNYHQQGPTATLGLASSANPYMYYDSPFIHTVYVNDLIPNQIYYYKPFNSCRTYSFSVPTVPTDYSYSSSSVYNFTLGLTADLGQTLVSNATINALIAMKPAAVLLVGDLSYADGWTPLWDNFGACSSIYVYQLSVCMSVFFVDCFFNSASDLID